MTFSWRSCSIRRPFRRLLLGAVLLGSVPGLSTVTSPQRFSADLPSNRYQRWLDEDVRYIIT
jgi:hypothetical protein